MNESESVKKPHWLLWPFMGPRGLRAGWRIVVFLMLVGAVQIISVLALNALGVGQIDLTQGFDEPLALALLEGLGVVAVVSATAVLALVERRPAAAYGLGGPRPIFYFGHGLLVGFGLMAAETGILLATGALQLEGVALAGSAVWRLGLEWAGAMLLVALLEELLLRGYLLWTLGRSLGFGGAALLTSALFGLGHIGNAGESPIGLLSAGLIGVVFCYSIWKTGSVWWAVGFHAAWNWAQTYVFGVGNSGFAANSSLLATHPTGPAWLSGGATGPEGSIWILAVMVAATLVIHYALGKPGLGAGSRIRFATTLPATSLLHTAHQRYDYVDSYAATIARQGRPLTFAELGQAFFASPPAWVMALFALRNALVKRIGLKTPDATQARPQAYEVGERLGLFKVLAKNEHELILGEDDKHLNFRVSLFIGHPPGGPDPELAVSTVVIFNNWLGRLYFFVVQPFHQIIVPTMLEGMVRQTTLYNVSSG